MKTDSKGNECPFCPENDSVDIVAMSASRQTYATKVRVRTDHGVMATSRAYFIIPVEHHLDYSTLEFDFLREATELKKMLNLSFDNEGFNMTTKGGKVIEHVHYWLMKAHRYDPPLGLYTLRERYREIVIEQRAAESRRLGW